MGKGEEKKPESKAREIPIAGADEGQGAADAAPAPEAEAVPEAEVSPEAEAEAADAAPGQADADEGADAGVGASVGEAEDDGEGADEGASDEETPSPDADAKAVIEEAEAVVADAERAAAAEAEAAALRDKYLRLQAEWDNYRKRTAEDAAQMRARAAEKLMGDVLPVLDDFERALAHAEANGEAGMLEGVKAISTKLSEVLAKHGLCAIDPAGEAFDALAHQAVGTVEDDSVPDETVAQVYQKGYKLGEKILRPAMVTISTGGPAREAEE